MPPPGREPPLRSALLGLEARRALGSLLPLFDDPALRDVLIHTRDGDGELWVDRGERLVRVPNWRAGPGEVRKLAIALIAAGGRQLDELHPCADAHLGEGIRVHAVLPPVSASGPALSIRVPRRSPLDFETLLAAGLCDRATAAFLRTAIVARHNLLITGGTGSGKTTLLAALLDLAAPDERIITIEDIAELRLAHPHRIPLEARAPNAEGSGELTVDRLLREALRMRPDRIVLGECRGAEVATLLSALNTGHSGGAGTLHANRLEDVPARLEALGMLAGYEPAVLARQAVSALHLVVHVERVTGHGHRIAGLGRLRLHRGALCVETA